MEGVESDRESTNFKDNFMGGRKGSNLWNIPSNPFISFNSPKDHISSTRASVSAASAGKSEFCLLLFIISRCTRSTCDWFISKHFFTHTQKTVTWSLRTHRPLETRKPHFQFSLSPTPECLPQCQPNATVPQHSLPMATTSSFINANSSNAHNRSKQ